MKGFDDLSLPFYMQYVPKRREYVREDNKPVTEKCDIELKIKGLKIPNYEKVKPLLVFKTNTYRNIEQYGTDANVWNSIFGVINMFFKTLTKEEQEGLVIHLMTLHHSILDFTQNGDMDKFSEFMNEKTIEVRDTEIHLDLCAKLKTFVINNINLGDFSNIGNDDRHTVKLTFYENEVIDLLTIVLLNKLYGPIVGVIITNIKSCVDCKLKEVHSVGLFKDLLKHKYQYLTDKLVDYIRNQVNKVFRPTYSTVFFAWTPSKLTDYIFASLLVRNYINVDLFADNGDIMTYTVVTCKKIIESKYKEASKVSVQPRVQFKSATGDDGNMAQMELDSITSKKTCDVVPIINSYISRFCDRYILKYNLDKDKFHVMKAYFKYHKIVPTDFNKFIACGLFGYDIGGSRGLLMLRQNEYTELMTTLSLICFDHNYYRLGHMVSAGISNTIKALPTRADNMLQLNYAVSFAYGNCKKIYDESYIATNGKEWDRRIGKLVEHLTKTNYVYNTPIEIWEDLKHQNINGKIIENDHELITELCEFTENLIIDG